MKITIKTLQQKSFTVVIDEDELVLALKEKIQAEQGPAYPADSLKLIYSGKILNDANKISEYNIQENNFVVVMVSKKVTVPKSQASTTSTSTAGPSTATPRETTQTQPTSTETTPQQETTPTTSGTQSTPTPASPMEQTDSESQPSMLQAASVLVTGSAYEKAIENLMGMGYTREQSMRAMQASFNNPDRAAEYLLEGKGDLPFSEEEQQQRPTQQSPQRGGEQESGVEQRGAGGGDGGQPTGEVVTGGDGSSGAGASPLQLLSRHPQFQQLRGELARNPQILPLFLQQIGQQNPELLQLINENQEEFLSLINAPPAPGESENPVSGGQGGGGGPPGTFSIPVTAEEKAAIDRLKSLGFPEDLVIQAYFACDKNEQLAANFLFEENGRN